VADGFGCVHVLRDDVVEEVVLVVRVVEVLMLLTIPDEFVVVCLGVLAVIGK
jgi:hypothetical protein